MRTRFSLGGVVLLTYGFILMPVLAVLAVSFNPQSRLTIDFTGLSLRWYRSFVSEGPFLSSLLSVSLPLAFGTAVIATIVGGLAAIALHRSRTRYRILLETAFMLPLLIPSILLGVALYLFFAVLGLTPGAVPLLISHVLIACPYVIRTVGSGLVNIDSAIEEAARNLGCSAPEAFVRVVLPLLRTSILSGAIFAFVESFSDINLALFLAGPQSTPLTLNIFSEITWQGTPVIAAASAVQILSVSLLIVISQGLFRSRLR